MKLEWTFFPLGYQLSRMQAVPVPGLQDELNCRQKFPPRGLPSSTNRRLLEHMSDLSVRGLNSNIQIVSPSF